MKTFLMHTAPVNIRGMNEKREKALHILQSRQMVSVKTLQESSGIYIRLMIEKSCGTAVRPAGKYFQGNMPRKANCSWPVGLSGICCHILSLLLYLKQYSDTKEKILELTYTQQRQKWHRISKKGSIPMVSLNKIKPKSASMKKN